MTKPLEAKRDPIPDDLTRPAGYSLWSQILDRVLREVLVIFMTCGALIGIVIWEAVFGFENWTRMPWLLAVAVVVAPLFLWRMKRIDRQMANTRLGLRGERWVGRYLERNASPLHYTVLHDLPFDEKDQANIDHVLIGPGGVFAIETKTISKPTRGEAHVSYDGQRVLINGLKPDRDPIAQVKGNAARVAEILKRETGHDVFVRPVLVYPRWFIEGLSRERDVWVLNEKALIGFLEKSETRLTREDASRYIARLEDYVKRVDEAKPD
jgi:hypothetical protein